MNNLQTDLLGTYVNFPDGHGHQFEGTVRAVYLVEDEVKVTVQVQGSRFMSVWLDNCIYGAIPTPDDEKMPRAKRELR